jgi:hypothetical protein
MTTPGMSMLIATATVGSLMWVRVAGCCARRYQVKRITGTKARELEIVGGRGAKRTLVDGGDTIWLRNSTGRTPEHRRVVSLAHPTRVTATLEPDTTAQTGLFDLYPPDPPSELDRYRRALQQIRDMLAGRKSTGELLEGPPEQVIADVGHALLVR